MLARHTIVLVPSVVRALVYSAVLGASMMNCSKFGVRTITGCAVFIEEFNRLARPLNDLFCVQCSPATGRLRKTSPEPA
jgi:hypothetical protein